MITKTKLCNFKLYYKDNEEKYKSIFADVVNYRFRTLKVFRNTNDTKVSLIDTEYGKYILKIFSPKTRKAERFLKSFIKGDYYKHLIVKTDRAKKRDLFFRMIFIFLQREKSSTIQGSLSC
ncbi:lipopolysaccharide core heptose(II) kinase RfaY [Kluyvera georgiana]|nr:lipopolysaccharide core heptose(II) kinase RfaY [Kluyvera georgiana]MDA8496216.1 lipopolysaccharide core heptose(II) kinase RfaY [Kluyvera georgiana]